MVSLSLFPWLIFRALGLRTDAPAIWAVALLDLVIIATVFVPVISLTALLGIWGERKVAGHIQSRIGPNRVGPYGLLQSIADGVKLILKEDLIPRDADAALMRLSPYLAFVPVFAAFLALPFGPDLTFEPRLSVGLFWILAMLSVEVMGVILAGWSSNNKWSVFGAMREACQMVSYEIPLGLSIIVGVMTAGTLNLVALSQQQGGGLQTWLIFRNPFAFAAFFVYFIASLASNKRAPFDLPESESELVAGYHTEFSGLRFSFFFFSEYAGMFIVGGIQAALFLGGWNDPLGLLGWADAHYRPLFEAQRSAGTAMPLVLLNMIGAGFFTLKVTIIVLVQMWVRWTLPRPRIDQVLYACVKVLLPMACVLLLGGALWQLLVPDLAIAPWSRLADGTIFNPWNLSQWLRLGGGGAMATQLTLAAIGAGAFVTVVLWIIYCAWQGGDIKQRLTDPADILSPALNPAATPA